MPKPSQESVALAVVPEPGALAVRPALSFVESFWKGKSPRTIKAYRDDILRVAAWAGHPDIDSFAEAFLSGGAGAAYRTAHEFRAYGAEDRKWSPSYVNNHLAALRSLVKFARRIERIEWALDIEDLKVETYRDTRGPGIDGLVALVEAARDGPDEWTSRRDEAVILIFSTMGLRRDEVVSLDVANVDLHGKRLWVQRKKKLQRVPLTVPDETLSALKSWLAVRGGDDTGPLFVSKSGGRQRADKRLAESSVWALVRKLGERAGIGKAWPHGLRHAAITTVLDETDGNLRSAQKFAGHSNPNVTTKYDDNRQDVAGQMASLVDKAIREKSKRRK